MSRLVPPHGSEELKPLLLEGEELEKEKEKAKGLTQVMLTSRETGDLIMMGIGGFTPLEGFMGKDDWKSVCENMTMVTMKDAHTGKDLFWPIPITLSTTRGKADSIKEGEEVALVDQESGQIMGTMKVTEKYEMTKEDKEFECQHVFGTTDTEHPGVNQVMSQEEVNLAGPVKVLSLGDFPEKYPDLFLTPAQTRKIFEEKGWSTVSAFQTRNPMHRSHEYLAKIAIEIGDGVLIHSLLGKLKPGDIPADVRAKAIDVLAELYFVKDTIVQAGYPLDMRYAGPREALLHALFRQNYGCTYQIVGRDHAGVGDYYGPFDAHKIFDEIPEDALKTKPLKIDWTFYCVKCDGMASMKTCPHGKEDRTLLSGTMLRKMLSEGQEVSDKFSRPEVVKILREYYENLEEKVEIKLHKAATGE
jgi:sulfate adenylyltransferase